MTAAIRTSTRQQLGAYYTPDWAVDYMVRQVDDLPSRTAIWEPASGDGAFVRGLLRAGVAADLIQAWDVNSEVRKELKRLGAHVTIADSLTRNDDATFDLVIGNPPYLNKSSDYLRANRQQLAAAYKDIGVHEAYAMFTYAAVNRLRPGGQLVFLISDTFLTLGTHQRLRAHLLENMRIDAVTLLPAGAFPSASVRTMVLKATRTRAPARHHVTFVDGRDSDASQVHGPRYRVQQQHLAQAPGQVFAWLPRHRDALNLVRIPGKLHHLLDGGLGMHTKDNDRWLRKPAPGPRLQAEDSSMTHCLPYHKTGGAVRWHAPLDHVVDWSTQAQASYVIPASALAGITPDGTPRPGLILSGVSHRLAARTMARGAMWESNKAFGLFPKDPDRYPVEFFVAILNSDAYAAMASALNNTVSLQIRDVKQLPMLPFTDEEIRTLAMLGSEAIAWVRDGGADPTPYDASVNRIVDAAAKRGMAGMAIGVEGPAPSGKPGSRKEHGSTGTAKAAA